MIETKTMQQAIDEISANAPVMRQLAMIVLNSEDMLPVLLGIRRAKNEGDPQLMRGYTDTAANMLDGVVAEHARFMVNIRATRGGIE
ncbi:MAG: hypothetical protein ABIM73_06530 [Arenimonas sp.]